MTLMKLLFSKWMFGLCEEMEGDDSWRFMATITGTGTVSIWKHKRQQQIMADRIYLLYMRCNIFQLSAGE